MNPPAPGRILLVRLSHLGDVVHALPVFHALRHRWPAAKLAWICQREFAPLLTSLPGLDQCLLFDRRGGLSGLWRARREMAAFGPDLTVDAQGNLKSALLSRLSTAPRRLALAPVHWQEPLGARFMTEFAPPSEGLHAIHKAASLIEAIGDQNPLSFDLGLSAADLDDGKTLLAEKFDAGSGQRWVLHLGRDGDPRTWPSEYFVRLARGLACRGDRALILSGPAEAGTGQRLAQELQDEERVTHWVGQGDLRQLSGFLSAAAAQGVGFVASDSGPSHLAAACGMRLRFLSGPQDPLLTGPWPLEGAPGSGNRVIRATPEGLGPMTGLSVESVLELL
ncbi:MAG TPA: lipopolysaccharide heptosyltransferase family protein [Planctomycetes bacterium]|nr:lipopolysaccharide heptosyltransferase family protein [Planctomycetota bacterium]HIK61582.1 lipopolysaccharide heptosyltransferase family protein [Planctomycetota bacterium]